MRVLVTGGSGFLGNAICRQLLARGDEVIACQRGSSDELLALGAHVVRGDIAEADWLSDAATGMDAVIHTAAKAGIWGPYDEYYRANVTGTQNVISACRKNSIPKLVFTSSPSIIHGGGDIEGGDETLPYPEHFNSPYPATKVLAEQQVMAANCTALHTVSLRPHLIWGPGDNHLLPHLLKRTTSGRLKLPGPEKLIDTVYIDNAVRAHLLALDRLDSDPTSVGGRTYFISNDEPMSQRQVIAGLLKASGRDVDISPISPRVAMAAGSLMEALWKLLRLKSEPPVTRWSAEHLSTAHWYDISAAKRDLGYLPEISISRGMELLAEACAETADQS
jgi:nucleoside-diphosphate-sugar epimerase